MHWHSYFHSSQIQHELRTTEYRWGILRTGKALSIIVKQQAPKYHRSWPCKSADTQVILSSKEVPRLHAHTQSATSECKMKTQVKKKKKASTPRECRLCSCYWSYFLLFTVTFRLATPHSIKLSLLRYLCVALEQTSGLFLCPDKTCRLSATFS